MHISDLQYDLPAELIAQQPPAARDASRLLVLDRATGRIEHRRFGELPELLRPEDCLAVNNTRVLPARFFARRETGGRVEVLFVREIEPGLWELLLRPSGRLREGESLAVGETDARLALVARGQRGGWTARIDPPEPAPELLERVGQTPLPPYIRRDGEGPEDRARYQTIYASQPGAVAAPTAGLHFTPELMEALGRRGIGVVELTLHVGPGTFQPVAVEDVGQHEMHAEWYCLPEEAVAVIQQRRQAGGRLVAVGTTSVRVLESCGGDGSLTAGRGLTDLFIYPPHEFGQVDAMVTNFHLPESTLLAMVQTFAGRESLMNAYGVAIERRYRFYSYGDAMLIRP